MRLASKLSFWVLLLLVSVALAGEVRFQAVNREDLGLVNTLASSSDAKTSTTLNSRLTSIGSTVTGLLIPPGTWSITGAVMFPANVTPVFAPGAVLNCASAQTVTFNGPLQAGLHQLFSGSCTVVFGSAVPTRHPHWWGALCNGSTNDTTAFAAAFAASGNGTLRLPAGTCLVNPGLTVPDGATLDGSYGARLKLTAQTSHALTLGSHTRVIGLTVEGVRVAETSGGDFAVFRMDTVSDVRLEGLTLLNVLGDSLRLADSSDIRVRDSDLFATRNCVTLNDDAGGSTRIWFTNVRCQAYLNGFQAESDDAAQVVDGVFVENFHVHNLQSPPTTSQGISFTKSTGTGAGTFRKYRNIQLSKITVVGAFLGSSIRGADRVTIDGYICQSCERGIAIGESNTVSRLTLSDFFIEADDSFGIITRGHSSERSSDLLIKDGTIQGPFTSSVGIEVDSNLTTVRQVRILGTGGATSRGIRALADSDDFTVESSYVRDTTTAGIQLDGGSGAGTTMTARHNTLEGGSATIATGISITGTSRMVRAYGNTITGTVTVPIDDASLRASHQQNLGADAWVGQVATSNATPATVVWQHNANAITWPSNQERAFEAHVYARRTGSSTIDTSYFILRGVVRNTADTYTLVGSVGQTVVAESDATSDATGTVDSANGLTVTVTGPAAKDYAWRVEMALQSIR